ncbi:MAG: ABC transporter ATP-binding protein, partial [Micromonosporaceae bacterium]
MSILEVENLHTVVGGLPVVRGVSFTVAPGETVALVGESGSGKTLTALSVMGLLPDAAQVTDGTVRYGADDLTRMPESQRRAYRGAKIAMIYQDPMTALHPLIRVGDQVSEGLLAHGVSKAEARTRTLEALDEVGLPNPKRIARAYPHQISGGQRQRVMIAMAVALRPGLLIADEPTTALDVTIQQQILSLVAELAERTGLAVLWITHDLGVVARIADRVMVMYAGRIVEHAPVRELFAAPRHPYTAGLLASVPPPRLADRAPLPQIGGLPPELGRLPVGCPYAPRCSQRVERCDTEEPPLASRDAGDAAPGGGEGQA